MSNQGFSRVSGASDGQHPSRVLERLRTTFWVGALVTMALTPACGSADALDVAQAVEDEAVTASAAEAITLADAPTYPFGAVDGSFSVDAQGAATYSLPIQVPPGIRGVEPKLSLSYRSGGGNGVVGVGWNLSGLSAVTRCPRTVAQDNVKGGVNGNAHDRFCLDGQRLIAIAGSYGANGSEYRTEIESFSRIFAYGTCGEGPCRIEVTDKTGNVAVFGETNNVSVFGDGTPRIYALKKLTDPNGNYLTVSYSASAGQLYPTQVLYTMHASAPGLKTRRVAFEYEDRADKEFVYVAGSKIATNQRLSRIKTYVTYGTTEKLVRDYQLAYGTSGLTKRSLLNSVKECDGLGVCLPATTFDYNSNAAGTDKFTMNMPTGTGLYDYQGRMRFDAGASLYPVDFDANGLTDLLRLEHGDWVADPAGNMSGYFFRETGAFDAWEPTGAQFTEHMNADQIEVYPFDYNGDGRTDFIRRERADWDNDASLTFGVYVAKNSPGFDVYYPGTQNSWGDFYQGLLGADGGTKIITGDFNGDGRGDFLRVETATWADNLPDITFNVFFSTGNGGNFNIVTPTGPEYGSVMRGDKVDLIPGDFNGDGKTDFIRREKSDWDDDYSLSFGVYYSRGDGYFDVSYPGSFVAGDIYQDQLRADVTPYYVNYQPRYTIANIIPGDFNGDGKTDFIRQQAGRPTDLNPGNNFNVYFSTGKNGNFERITPAEPAYVPAGEPPFYGSTMNGDNVDIIPLDYNGDGKTDFLRREKGAWQNDAYNTLDVYISKGDGTFDRIRPGTQGDFYDFYQGGCRGSQANLIPADVDGDGKSDFIRQEWGEVDDDAVNTFQVFFANGDDAGDYLKKVTNGLGGTTDVTYKPLNHSTVYSVTASSTDAAYPNMKVRGSSMYVVQSTTVGQAGAPNADTFTYRYYDALVNTLGRGFLGFGTVVQNGPTGTTQTSYNQDFPLTGTIREKDSLGPNLALVQTLSTYTGNQTAYGTYLVQLTREDTIHTEGNVSPKPSYTKRREFIYDEMGNIAISRDLGRLDDVTDNVDSCTVWLRDTANWRIALPAYSRVADSCTYSAGACTCQGVKKTVDRYYYGSPNMAETWEFDDLNGYWIPTYYSYDVHGNMLTRSLSGTAARIIETTTYDSDYKTYPTTQTRASSYLSHTTNFEYDPRFGTLASQTDANGNTVANQYDGLGRVAALWTTAPSGILTATTKTTFGSDSIGTYRLTNQLESWTGNTWRWERNYLDGEGREWRTDSQSTDPNKPVVVKREYDAFGQTKKESLPFYLGDPEYYTTYSRDLLGRVTQMVAADGTATNIGYNVDTACAACVLLETTTEAFGTAQARTSTRHFDVDGRVVRQQDSDNRVTSFKYDKLGRQIEVTDAAGTTTLQYDALDRLVSSNSPDRGLITNQYIPGATWLSATNFANGQRITYSYDPLGRVLQKVVVGKQTTSYWYDETAFANAIGRLTGVTVTPANSSTPTSTNNFSYTRDGRVATNVIRIDNTPYTVISNYDPQGRLTGFTYPDGTTLTRSYNSQGLLAKLTLDGADYATFQAYAPGGQPKVVSYGNGTTTNLTYDSMTRLTTSKVTKPNTANLLDYAYTWDAHQRITALTDLRDATRTQSFGYTAGGQLTSASSTMYGSLSYGYDNVGNLILKEGVAYQYTGHRVTSAPGFTATYDASGQRTGQTKNGVNWAYSYDGDGHLAQVTKNNVIVNQFAYDFTGERVKKVDTNNVVTHYVTPNYEVVFMPDGRKLKTRYVNSPMGRVAANTTETPAGGATALPDIQTLDLMKAQFAKNTVEGLAGYIRNRALVLSLQPWARPTAMGLLACFIATLTLGLARRRFPERWAKAAKQIRSLFVPGQTDYARRHPLFALAVPVVLATFLSACGNAPQAFIDENTAVAESELIPGQNGAGYPVSGLYYFHANHLASSSLITDSTGAIMARVEYKPYGEMVPLPDDGADMFRSKFTGKEWDKDSELYDYHARHYDPFTGRFLTADSLLSGGSAQDATSLNPYAYANNNPVTYTDPSGHFFFLVIIVAVVVGAYCGGMSANGTWNPTQWNWNSWQTYVGMAAGAAAGAASAGIGTSLGGFAGAFVGSMLESVVINGLRFISPQGSSLKDFGTSMAIDTATGAFMAKYKPIMAAKGKALWNKLVNGGRQATAEAAEEAAKAAAKPSRWSMASEAALDVGKGGFKLSRRIGMNELRTRYSDMNPLATPNPRGADVPPPSRVDGSMIGDYTRNMLDALLGASGADDLKGRASGDWSFAPSKTTARGAARAPKSFAGFAVVH